MVPEVPREALLSARRGDRAAFRTVAEVLARYTYNVAYRMTYGAADAEDLTQDIFLRLYQNLDKYDATLPFGPWYRALATRTALNWRRSRRSRPVPIENVEVAVHPEATGDLPEHLRNAVRDLPEDYRMVVTLRYLEDLGVDEIARAMGKPSGTIKTWLFRARDMLKDKLKMWVES
ncbi:MAG: RNA polymerase sigma factor [Planctomycetota bacterium]|jgi:RNA polymerase sigma-70 factor (ECF subfamily)